MLEAGLNRRDRDTAESHYDGPDIQTRSVTYAARFLFGWSWRLTQHSYLAAALGFSVGREAGRETITPDEASANPMPTTANFHRQQDEGEAYLRFGVAFGR